MKNRAIYLATLVVCLIGLVGSVGWAEDLAELTVRSITVQPPTVVDRGGSAKVSSIVMNTSSTEASDFAVQLFYRLSNGASPWTAAVGQVVTLSLGGQQSDTVSFTFDTEAFDSIAGTYELRVVADATDRIPEVDELNNELTTTISIADAPAGRADLEPVSLTYHRTSSGDVEISVDIAVLLPPTRTANLPSFSVEFNVQGVTKTIDNVSSWGTGQTLVVTAQFSGLSSGAHLVSVVVDSEDAVENERDEGNNTITGTLTLMPHEFSPQGLTFSRGKPYADEEVQVAATIVSSGTDVSPPPDVEVAFYVGEQLFATTTAFGLQAGTSQEVTATLVPGSWNTIDSERVLSVRVEVDPSDALDETDEANNTLTRTLTVIPAAERKAEIHPESIALNPPSPVELQDDGAVTVRSTIRNTGRSDAEDFSAVFSYRVKGGVAWTNIPCVDATACSGIDLGAGEEMELVATLSLLRSATGQAFGPGVYEVRILTDAESAIDELDERNNEMVTTVTVRAARRPDLAIAILPLEPSALLLQGQTARVNAAITNVGESAAGAFEIEFSYCKLSEGGATAQQQIAACSDAFTTTAVLPDSRIWVDSLAVGETKTIQVSIETALLEPGLYRIQAEADPDRQILESDINRTNNLGAASLTVWGADLAPVQGTFKASPDGVIDQTAVDEIEFDVTVANIGVLAAGSFNVAFELLRVDEDAFTPVRGIHCGGGGFQCANPPYFGVVTLPGIGAGEQLPVSCTLDLSDGNLEPGEYIVRVQVDCVGDVDGDLVCDGQIPEHVELNNSAELLLTIVGGSGGGNTGGSLGEGADLAVEAVNGRARAGTDWITAYGVIRNLGTAASGPFSVEIVVTLPSGESVSRVEVAQPGLDPDDQISIGVQFLHGSDFDEALAVGSSLDVTVRVLNPDAVPENNVGTRRLTVRT